jgi:hypothetical protein
MALDLKEALNMFTEGVQSLAVSNALNKANEQVQAIKMSGIKDTEQRVQLGQLAQNLVGQMSQFGANAAAVEQARLAFTPKTFQNAEQLAMDAKLTGNTEQLAVADQLRMDAKKDEMALFNQKVQAQEKSQMRQFKQQTDIQTQRDNAAMDRKLMDEQIKERMKEAMEANRKPTTDESAAALYSKRMALGEGVLDTLTSKGFDPTSVPSGFQSSVPNMLRSKEFQKYHAAKQNMIAAIIRPESGAAISKDEYAQADLQYFPQQGDSPEVVEQKKKLREGVLQSYKYRGAHALQKEGIDPVTFGVNNSNKATQDNASRLPSTVKPETAKYFKF